ncbi:MAG: hypothetical protein GY754_32825, partial [bacterium]|nr:hypothetical protein [bacterium]
MKNFFSTAIALIVFFSFFGCEEGLKDDWNKTIVAPRFTTDNPAAVINSEGRLISNCDINAVIYSSDDEADIYYSLDNGGTWSRYFAPIPVKGNGSDIQIIAYAEIDRHGESERTEARFVVNYDRDIDPETIADNPRNQVYAPEFVTDNPANTNFTADSVTCYGKMSAVISTRTAGAVIYFSFDELIWLPYVDKIPLEGHGSDITIFAKAIKDGMLDSDVTNRQYIVDYTGSDWQVAAPEFGTDDPLNTQYSNSTFVCKDDMNAVISTVTEGSVIKYSFDQVNWWRYIEEIPIVGMDTDFTIYAKASKAGMVDSGIVSRRFRMGYVFTSAPVFQLA